jgi:hypothetical protein
MEEKNNSPITQEQLEVLKKFGEEYIKSKRQKSFAYKLGRFLGSMILICLSTAIMAVLITLTVAFVKWMFGGIV